MTKIEKNKIASSLRQSEFFSKLSSYYALAPSAILARTAEAELLSKLSMEPPILDMGCGDGFFASLIKPRGVDVGCDILKDVLKKAKKRKQYKYLVQCDATKSIPFRNEYFGTVFSNSSLEHMDNVDKVLNEVARILKQNGKFIFTLCSNYAYKWWPLSEKAKQEYLDFQPVYNYFSLNEWEKRLSTAGLRIVEIKYYLDKRATRTLKWLDYHFGKAYLTSDLTFSKLMVKFINLLPRKVLVKFYMYMLKDLQICVDKVGGGILIVAKK